jgi:hypothetical protein
MEDSIDLGQANAPTQPKNPKQQIINSLSKFIKMKSATDLDTQPSSEIIENLKECKNSFVLIYDSPLLSRKEKDYKYHIA